MSALLEVPSSCSWSWGVQYDPADVARAAEYGLERMNQLVKIQEPRLYDMGAWLQEDNPARYVAAFNDQSPEARRLATFGYASLQATSKLIKHEQNGRGMERLKFLTISLLNTSLHDQCPLPDRPDCPPSSSRYRSADGRCNNPAHPWWGASMMALRRFLPPHYKDGLERIRDSASGGPLPSARAVSTAVHSDRDVNLTTITHMVMQWGQFLDHDLTASSQTKGFNGSVPKCCTDGGRNIQPPDLLHPDCLPIIVPPDDWFYGPYGVRCLEFVRSSATSRIGCSLGPRDQINQVTSFIDASNVYGSSQEDSDRLRLHRNGLLKYNRVQHQLPLLPLSSRKADLCRERRKRKECFEAGDKRVNEQPGLIALHVVWLRVHNRLAVQLAHLNPHWNDEKLYQETRRIVIAMMQHITYREFLPIILGPDIIKLFDLELKKKGYYDGYDIKINPTAANVFGTAAFRFGHSLVQHNLLRCDRSHSELPSTVSLYEELTIPTNLHSHGSVDKLLLGLCTQPSQKRDEFITEQLTNHLFQTPRYHYGMDLAALNIQRGRDHGLPPYNAWRAACGLQPFTHWDHLLKVMSPGTQRNLKYVYRDIEDIDLFPGALAEKPVIGGLVGPTFACILAQQFSNLRKGDRFWYENEGFASSFTPSQLHQLRRVTLSRILCDNLDSIDTVQRFVFLAADHERNKHVACSGEWIPYFDLTPWTEYPKHKYSASHHNVDKGNVGYKSTTESQLFQIEDETQTFPSHNLNNNHYPNHPDIHHKPEIQYLTHYHKPQSDHTYSSTQIPEYSPINSSTYKPQHTSSFNNYSPVYEHVLNKPNSHNHIKPNSTIYVYEITFENPLNKPSYTKPESHDENSPSFPHTHYPKPHVDYPKPKPQDLYSNGHTQPGHPKPQHEYSYGHTNPGSHEHSTSHSQSHYPKPQNEYSYSHTKPGSNEHSTSHSQSHYPKPQNEYSYSHTKPGSHEHSTSHSQSHYPKPQNEYSYSHTNPGSHEHSTSHSQSHYPKPQNEYSYGHTKPGSHEHSTSHSQSHYPKPQNEYSYGHTNTGSHEHSTSHSQSRYPKPQNEYSYGHTKPGSHEHSTGHSQPHYPKPQNEYSYSYSESLSQKPHEEYTHGHTNGRPEIQHLIIDSKINFQDSDTEQAKTDSISSFNNSDPSDEHPKQNLQVPEVNLHKSHVSAESHHPKHQVHHQNQHITPNTKTAPNSSESQHTSFYGKEYMNSGSEDECFSSDSDFRDESHNSQGPIPEPLVPSTDFSREYTTPSSDVFYETSSYNQHGADTSRQHSPNSSKTYQNSFVSNTSDHSLFAENSHEESYEPISLQNQSILSQTILLTTTKLNVSHDIQPVSSSVQYSEEPIHYDDETMSRSQGSTPYSDLEVAGEKTSTEKEESYTNFSEEWHFNEDEIVEEDVPEIPAVASDLDALYEMPKPMKLTEDDENGRSL